MRFAHIADCHIGSWRDPKLGDLGLESFNYAVERCISQRLDFILIAGDLFNTAIPSIDRLKSVVEKLTLLKSSGISVYIIPGSHDFSPSGKTMLDVLESAGLCINVVKGTVIDEKLRLDFTVDEKTGAKITGMLGKKGTLEKGYYEDLDRDSLEKEPGFKIFMLHSAITELKSKGLENMESIPQSMLPKGFDYYAAGHVHERKVEKGDGVIVYPGPLFPNNFKELEELGHGGFYIYDDSALIYEEIKLHNTIPITIDCSYKTPESVQAEILAAAAEHDCKDAIMTMRVAGKLSSGRVSDIDFKAVFDRLYERGAYFVMKNTAAIQTEGFEAVKVHEEGIDDIEDSLISEHLGQVKVEGMGKEQEREKVHKLMQHLNQEKEEGERNPDFEKRIVDGMEILVEKDNSA